MVNRDKNIKIVIMLIIYIILGILWINSIYASEFDETRYCGQPKRNAQGKIIRRTSVINAFKEYHPCPATGLSTGVCEGWEIDHVIPLACGGCDAVSNMQWLPISIKRGLVGKDSFERKIYGGVIVNNECTAPLLK